MNIYDKINKEYDSFKKQRNLQEDLQDKARELYHQGEIETANKIFKEVDAFREPMIDTLIKAAQLCQDIYTSRINAGKNHISFEVNNYFIFEDKIKNQFQPLNIKYRVETEIVGDKIGETTSYFQLLPSHYEQIVYCTSEKESLETIDTVVSRKSNTEVESFDNFINRVGYDYSNNIIDIMKTNKKENLVRVLSLDNNLEIFQKSFNEAIKEMSKTLSGKDLESTEKAIDKFANGVLIEHSEEFIERRKKLLIDRIYTINQNSHKSSCERDLAWQEINTTSKNKMK